MSDKSGLDAILGGGDEAHKPETPPVTEPQPGDGQVEATGEKPDAAPPAVSKDANDGPSVPRKALEDERRKRQDLERQLEALTKAPPQAPQQPPPQRQPIMERPDPWTDPEGSAEWDRAMFANQLFETRVVTSRELMVTTKPDFEEYEKVFVEAAQRDPRLRDDLFRHPLPAKFAYEQGRRIAMLKEIGDDPAAYRERLRQEVIAEVQSQQQPASQSPPAAQPPKSLAATPSSQPRDNKGRFSGPASLDDLLGG